MKIAAAWLAQPEIQKIETVFARAGFALRFVGGCVRDTLLGRDFSEIDAATNATPEQMIALCESAGIRVIPTGLPHGTITALVGDKSFEITTLRNDVATDGRHAQVMFTASWEEDAKRRDFTMNALYLDIQGTLYDYVGGLDDCRAHRVKFIGDAAARIQEDYLRILRYFRFVATIGDNQFDATALAACHMHKDGIAQLSGERIQHELMKLLAAEYAGEAVEKLVPLLSAVLPFVYVRKSIYTIEKDACFAGSNKALLKLAVLMGSVDNLKQISARLKLSGRNTKTLERWLTHAPLISPAMSSLAQKKLLRKLGGEAYVAAVHLACALSVDEWKDYAALLAMAQWSPPPFPVAAEDLMAQGFTQGKALGDKLKELEILWEDSGYQMTREALLTR